MANLLNDRYIIAGVFAKTLFEGLRDQFSVEAAVLDEDLVRALACDDHSREIDARNVAFECGWIADRAAVVRGIQLDSEPFDEVEVRMIAG